MEEIIKDLQRQLEWNTFTYNTEMSKVKAGEANYHPQTIQNWEERIDALAEAIGLLTKYNEK